MCQQNAAFAQVETDAQAYVLNRIKDLSQDIVSRGGYIKETIDRATAHIVEGYHVNSLGELQGQGVEYDRLCALREEMCTIARVLRCADEQVVYASTGSDVWFTSFEVDEA